MGTDLSIKGDLSASEDITVGFTLEGSIDIPGHKLTVLDGAAVQARVKAASVIVHGRLDGHVSAERLEVTSTGSVQGSVISPKLRVHDGAVLNGPVNTERAQAAANISRHKQQRAG